MAAKLGSAPARTPPRTSPTLFKASRRFNPSSVLLENDVGDEAGTKALAEEITKAKAQALLRRTILRTDRRVFEWKATGLSVWGTGWV